MRDRLKLLVSLPFVTCLMLLLVNDFFLKPAFHNTLTGKLSDLCGLFIFPIFWSVFFSRRQSWIFILSGILFIYWKSEHASAFIEFFSINVFNIQRTVDPTDLIALPVLWLAWLSIKDTGATIVIHPISRRLSPYLIAAVTIFSFCATSQPRYVQSFDQPQYVLFKSDAMPDTNSYGDDIDYYKFDTLLVAKVNQLFTSYRPIKNDDYNKNLAIRDLDKDIFTMVQGNKSLMKPGKVTYLTVKTQFGEDSLRFNGGRLDGRFIRKKGKKTLIEGFYKMGIEDSTWTLRDTSSTAVTRKTFINGERTKVEQFEGDKLISSNSINTRADTRRNKYIQIGVLVLLMVSTIVLLVKNYRKTDTDKPKIQAIWKVLLCLVAPIFVWLLQLGITILLGSFKQDIFETLAIIVVIYIATCPLFIIILFWIKLRKPADMLWYCLLFALAFSTWMQYSMLIDLSL